MYQCRVCFIENRVATGTPPKMTSQETGDFPGGDVARNGRFPGGDVARNGFTSDTPGHPGIPDTNEVCCVL